MNYLCPFSSIHRFFVLTGRKERPSLVMCVVSFFQRRFIMGVEILLGISGLLLVVGVYFWFVRKPSQEQP